MKKILEFCVAKRRAVNCVKAKNSSTVFDKHYKTFFPSFALWHDELDSISIA
jgi:hypothetical protein